MIDVKIIIPRELTLFEIVDIGEKFIIETKDEKANIIEVDLGLCQCLDSSGLGFLIYLRARSNVMKLQNVSENMAKTFKVYGAYDLLCGS